jgi:hypothetical protein
VPISGREQMQQDDAHLESLDYLVGKPEQSVRNLEAEGLSGLEDVLGTENLHLP